MTTTATPAITRPCACMTRLTPIGHDDVIAESSRSTGHPLAQTVACLYPTERS